MAGNGWTWQETAGMAKSGRKLLDDYGCGDYDDYDDDDDKETMGWPCVIIFTF